MNRGWSEGCSGEGCPESQGGQIVGGMTGPGKGLGPSPEGESI